jgi:4-hydroxy-3-methylbut-2-enyl diphosphate reductase
MAKTTLSKIVYNEIKSYIDKEFLNSKIGNTICGATYVRQEAVEELAKKTDIVLIVGGKNSSNTKKLYEISKKINERSYLLENYKDFDKNWLKDAERVGITAGASTPEKSIREIERIIKGEVL